MDDYASEGYRTLMFAKKDLGNFPVENIADEDEKNLEGDLTLLGVTALEDLLQDNVHDCIRDFRAARIKVWMLTGDKGETAHSIGISCGLINTDLDEDFKIDNEGRDNIAKDL